MSGDPLGLITTGPTPGLTRGLTLGLTVGASSIGWAVIDEAREQLLACGVRAFREGVVRSPQGGEQSKTEQRRIARGQRRRNARRTRRKMQLRQALVFAGLLPESALRPISDPERQTWEHTEFRREDPYQLRARALREQLEPYEIGRALLHLNQRRGFFSIKTTDKTTDHEPDLETSRLLAEMNSLSAEVGERTLGTFLAERQAAHPGTRLRGRHPRRTLLEAEFLAIWQAQQKFHPNMLTETLAFGRVGRESQPRAPRRLNRNQQTTLLSEVGLFGLMFFQRPLVARQSQRPRCPLEPHATCCHRADRAAQRFRLLHEISLMRLVTPAGELRPLSGTERERLLSYVATSREKTFAEIRKHLGLEHGFQFHWEGGDRQSLRGLTTDAVLAHKQLFGKQWHHRPDSQKTSIVRALLAEDPDTILRRAQEEWGLDAATAELLADVHLGEGSARFSLTAIEKLLPHLEHGLPLTSRAGNNDRNRSEDREAGPSKNQKGAHSALEAAGYLRPTGQPTGQPREQPGAPQRVLPAPAIPANPLIRTALHELRKVVNAILREYGLPPTIRLCLAHDVKGTSDSRSRARQARRDLGLRRAAALKIITQIGAPLTRDNIERYLLWEEQGGICFYSFPDRPIRLAELFTGDLAVDLLVPFSQSLDDTLSNKVLCLLGQKQVKGDQTPYTWLARQTPQKYAALLERTDRLPPGVRYRKRRKCGPSTATLEMSLNRQLTDGTYSTRQVAEYLSCLGAEIICPTCQLTAQFRQRWELTSVLQQDTGLNLKPREDLRQHAVTAIIVALTNRSRLVQLSQCGTSGQPLPVPWSRFPETVAKSVNSIVVSHRSRRRVSGPLHEQTHYSLTAKSGHREVDSGLPTARPWASGWVESAGEFASRKRLTELTLPMIHRIRDPEVRRVVVERLVQFQLDLESPDLKRSGQIPAEVWREPLYLTRKPGRTSQTHTPAMIKSVRVLKTYQTINAIRGGRAHVIPGRFHHAAIFEYQIAAGKLKREVEYVTLLEANRRLLAGEPIVNRVYSGNPEARFVMSLTPGDMLLADFLGQQRPVVVINLLSTTNGFALVDAIDGRPAAKKKRESKTAGKLQGRKITVDCLGRIRWAND